MKQQLSGITEPNYGCAHQLQPVSMTRIAKAPAEPEEDQPLFIIHGVDTNPGCARALSGSLSALKP